jgi:RimJ/RimL family protein N-acetyltransferase
MDLGFALLEAYWKGGYGFESASAVLRYAGAVFQCPRLLAITKPGNENSVRLLLRLGFVPSRQVTDPDTGGTLLVYALNPVEEMEQRP